MKGLLTCTEKSGIRSLFLKVRSMADFDPYYEWLAIPPGDQPPHHYRLLGIDLFEQNPNVIERAADKQMAFLKTVANGKQSALAQRLLNEVSAARICLLTPAKKAAYDYDLPSPPKAGVAVTRSLALKAGVPRLSKGTPGKGTRIVGEYEIIEKIGAGGMGEVFKAQHRRMKRIVALKILPQRSKGSADAAQRFQREVEAAAKLTHPNIVTAYDAGEQDGITYLAMEYVDGVDLSSFVKQHGPLPVEHAIACVLQAARGLQYAHEQGIVHRDVKPANLLIDRSGTVKILDMGLARIDDLMAPSAELTSTGQIVGTVEYMSPEQAKDTHRVDHRADIYSLGCTLYRLLTGTPLFFADSQMGTIFAHREASIRSLRATRSDVPEWLDAAFQRMVAKRPDDRFGAMAEVVSAFENGQMRSGEGIRVTSASSSTRLCEFLVSVTNSTVLRGVQAGDVHVDTRPSMLASQPTKGSTAALKARGWRQQWLLASVGGVGLFLALGVIGFFVLPGLGWRRPQQPAKQGHKSATSSQLAQARPHSFPDANPKINPAAEGEEKWQDLLALIDPKRDGQFGDWQLADGKLSCSSDGYGECLIVPMAISGSYSVRARFVANTEHGIALVLPAGSGQFEIIFDGEEPADWSYMELVNGLTKWVNENPTRSKRFQVVPGREHVLQIDVKIEGENASVRARADNIEVIAWQGPQSSLTLWRGKSVPAHKIGISNLKNKAKVMTQFLYAGAEVTSPATPDRKAAEWALSLSGTIKVQEGEVFSELFSDRKRLPANDFWLVDVYLGKREVSDADLARACKKHCVS